MNEHGPKRTVAEIGSYFNGEVERFSDLEKGQASIKDARLMMDLLAETASALVPETTILSESLFSKSKSIFIDISLLSVSVLTVCVPVLSF